MTNIEIYQGDQIGGCITVISGEKDGVTHRIMIDYGSQLPGSEKTDFEYPWDEKPVDAVFFTHNHTDHIGRINEIPEGVDLYLGDVARRVIMNMQGALASLKTNEAAIHQKEYDLLNDSSRVHSFLFDGKSFEPVINIPGFRIEPYRVDHSAYDSYMYLIEVDDESMPSGKKVILHTGDYRGHGRIGETMIPIIENEIHKNGRVVNTLITEGTMLSRSSEKLMTEEEMTLEAAEYLKQHKYAFLICASTNLDAIASFYQAAQMAASPKGRYLYTYNKYFKSQIELFSKTAGNENSVYKIDKVFALDLTKSVRSKKWTKAINQKYLMELTGFLACIKPEDYCKKYIVPFVEDYKNGKIDQMPVIIYSMWNGYINPDSDAQIPEWVRFMKDMRDMGVEIKHLHTSGHASTKMICDVIKAVNPSDEILPIHTECQEGFKLLDIPDELKEKVKY